MEYLELFLSFACFFLGGTCRAIFECIILFDSLAKSHGKYWSRDLFCSNKDRNNDGKISWLESTFPKDGCHNTKVVELLLYGGGSAFLYASHINFGNWIFAIPFVIWFVISTGFELEFRLRRK